MYTHDGWKLKEIDRTGKWKKKIRNNNTNKKQNVEREQWKRTEPEIENEKYYNISIFKVRLQNLECHYYIICDIEMFNCFVYNHGENKTFMFYLDSMNFVKT